MNKERYSNSEGDTHGRVLGVIRDKLKLLLGFNDIAKMSILIDQYIMKKHQGKNNLKTLTDKSNTKTHLTQLNITFRTFFKFLSILEIKKVKFTVTITTKDDKVFSVGEEVNFRTEEGFVIESKNLKRKSQDEK